MSTLASFSASRLVPRRSPPMVDGLALHSEQVGHVAVGQAEEVLNPNKRWLHRTDREVHEPTVAAASVPLGRSGHPADAPRFNWDIPQQPAHLVDGDNPDADVSSVGHQRKTAPR